MVDWGPHVRGRLTGLLGVGIILVAVVVPGTIPTVVLAVTGVAVSLGGHLFPDLLLKR